MTTRSRILVSLLLILASLGLVAQSSPIKTRPNIIIILADDLGYGDIGCYGNQIIKTPNLDKLADMGIRYTDFYSSSPMCSPSRAGLLTGRAPYRTGIYDWIAPDSTMFLSIKEITIATLLKNSGYSTSLHGKWHLNGMFNSTRQTQPGDHGFDYWFGIQYNVQHLNPEGFFRNNKEVQTQGYACDIVTNDAISWLNIERKNDKPFFQFICYLEPHEPIMSPKELVDQYKEHNNKAEYYANVTNLDRSIGRLLQTLEDLDLAENTILIFTSDNGPAEYTPNGYFNKSHGSTGPLKGFKRHTFEGGLRVPGIIAWPGKIKAGSESNEPISNLDILPTICAIAGIKIPGDRTIDGSDFTPSFAGKKLKRRIPLHWEFYDPTSGPQTLIRDGNWILGAQWDVGDFHKAGRFSPTEVAIIKSSKPQKFSLYNIREDIHQDNDRSATNPKKLNQLKRKLLKIHKEVMEDAYYPAQIN